VFDGAKKCRHMEVVATGVHGSWPLRAKFHSRVFMHRESIHIGPKNKGGYLGFCSGNRDTDSCPRMIFRRETKLR
jgi:hypothetical protein